MSYHPHQITVEIAANPARARRRVEKLIRKHRCDLRAVASELGVTYRSVHRYITKLDLRDVLERERSK